MGRAPHGEAGQGESGGEMMDWPRLGSAVALSGFFPLCFCVLIVEIYHNKHEEHKQNYVKRSVVNLQQNHPPSLRVEVI